MKIIIYGSNGRMGREILALAAERGIEVTCGIDTCPTPAVETFTSLSVCNKRTDAIIDFSNPSSLSDILSYATKTLTPVVLATTGYSAEQKKQIEEAATVVPILQSGNMSMGVNLLLSLVKKTYAALGEGFDIEIIEKHHNKKLDAPSGTALMLADAINEQKNSSYAYGRNGVCPRKNEIAIHAVRGGTIVGEHDVVFAGDDEIITISHSARSRKIFASGALSAAQFLMGKPPKLYNMSDVIG